MGRAISGGLLVVVLTDDVAVLQGSGVDETARAQKHSPILRGINYGLRLLPSISLVQKRKHHGVSEEEYRYRSTQAGQYTQKNRILLALTCI